MLVIGLILIIVGVGSIVLGPLDVEILEWADGAQPVLGIVIALVGLGLVGARGLLRSRSRSRSER